MFGINNITIMMHGIIRRENETVLYLTLPLGADCMDVQWAKNRMMEPLAIQVQMVELPMFYRECNGIRICTVYNHYNVNRIVTTMHTEQKMLHPLTSLI